MLSYSKPATAGVAGATSEKGEFTAVYLNSFGLTTVNILEILNPRKIFPLNQVPDVCVIILSMFSPIEFVRKTWKTWPPVSMSTPVENELYAGVELICPGNR